MAVLSLFVLFLAVVAGFDDLPDVETLPNPGACSLPTNGLPRWRFSNQYNGPYQCSPGVDSPWAMLNAYRSGGKEGVHWKYTDKDGETGCLYNWNYHASDGTTLFGSVKGYSTLLRSTRRWCALAIYRAGGVTGKQWAPCKCT